MSLEGKRTLIFAILKFLRVELKQENITADMKESLEGKFICLPFSSLHKKWSASFLFQVASQCLESSYEISVDDELCKNNFDSGLNLLELAEKSVIKVKHFWNLIIFAGDMLKKNI